MFRKNPELQQSRQRRATEESSVAHFGTRPKEIPWPQQKEKQITIMKHNCHEVSLAKRFFLTEF
jgi:hypothetical protein